VLPLRTESAFKSYESLQKEIQKNGSIVMTSGADYLPGSDIWTDSFYYPDGGQMATAVDIRRNSVDARFMDVLRMKLIAGRNFSDNRQMEEGKVIVNRVAAERLGFKPEEIVGRDLYREWQGKKYTETVIGVMEDYHQTGLKEAIVPVLFQMAEKPQYENLIVSVHTNDFDRTLASLEQIWKAQVSDTPFEYSFLDQNISHQYDEDKRVSRIITSFTLIAMLISCLGLYGLSSYMAERRFKEIGIRKVMGANVTQIVSMMSTEFVKLVMIAFVTSVPLAWYGMNQWLESFAYRIAVDPVLFVIAGAAALVVALLTVSFESMKAALHNPVDALRNE